MSELNRNEIGNQPALIQGYIYRHLLSLGKVVTMSNISEGQIISISITTMIWFLSVFWRQGYKMKLRVLLIVIRVNVLFVLRGDEKQLVIFFWSRWQHFWFSFHCSKQLFGNIEFLSSNQFRARFLTITIAYEKQFIIHKLSI